ncbi:MAG: phosphatase PAP2 family protein [Deltaproteobacteria bacterium]|nr:phosphatase PAP2 family protein [Deltaproteobacteria bacterium]
MTQLLDSLRPSVRTAPRLALFGGGPFTLQDLIPLAYLALIRVLVWQAVPSPARALSAWRVDGCILALVGGALLCRGLVVAPRWRAVVYRLCLMAVVIESYLMLRDLLPLLRSDSFDQALLDLDLAVFGFEPAFWLERFNLRPVVEYFSFFYFSYFALVATYLVVMLWVLRPGRATSEYAIGSFLVLCLGQLGYLVVPGTGPIHHFADQFAAPVDGGFFWSCVTHTVAAGGALRDIFPSLHTAVPTWYALFSWTQARRDRRWRPAAVVCSWFALNIMLSTMVLRWHYLVDVIAGLALALLVSRVAPRLAAWEARRRQRLGLPAPWSFAV